MTFAPKTLTDLMAYWKAQGGVNLGIVGDTAHQAKGTSYHLGQSNLVAGAYSARLPRDREPHLTDAAAATDLGKLNGSYKELRLFSEWLVKQALAGKCHDIREIIYCSSNGLTIKRWSGPDNKVYTSMRRATPTSPWVVVTPGNGDSSHAAHTHISYYRDSEFRSKIQLFSPYPPFKPAPAPVPVPVPIPVPPGGPDMPAFKTFATPKLVAVPKGGRIFTNANLAPNNDPATGDIIVDPARDLPVSGVMADGTLIVGYRDTTPTETVVPTYYFKGTPKDYPAAANATSCKPFTDPLASRITVLEGQVATAHHDGQQAEWDRQAAGATVKVELLPRP